MRRLVLPFTLALLWALTGAASATAQMLMGDQDLGSYADSNNAGMTQAFHYTATTSGNASDIELYVNSGTTATSVYVGLYSDVSGKPGSLLALGSLRAPQSKTWNDIELDSSATLMQGNPYWIAVLGTGGKLAYLDTAKGSAPSYVNSTKNLSALPQTYSAGAKYNMSPASAYVIGTVETAAALLGDQSIAPSSDSNSAGVAQAFAYHATASGTTSDIELYVNSGTTATKLTLGLYTDTNGKPGSLIASGSISSPVPQAWNDVNVGAVSVTAGNTYWIALLAIGGEVDYADTWDGSAASYVNSAAGLTSLPATYSVGTEYGASPATAYVMGTSGALPAAPVNTAVPAVNGQAVQGQTLSTSNGSWSGGPASYAYGWEDCNSAGGSCTSIAGATSSSYTLQAGDVGHTVRSVVTATNAGGSASASSAATATVAAPPPAAPVNTAVPAVSGQAVQGQTLSTSNGSWSGGPASYAYGWEDCNSAGGSCTSIAGATSSSYTLQAGDVGHTVRSVVTATNAGGSASASSAATGVVTAASGGVPVSTSAPTISGTAQVGSSLTASPGSWSNSPTGYAYQWEDCDTSGGGCTSIAGATSSAYTVASSDVGSTLEVMVTARNASGSGSASSSPTGVVAAGSGGGGVTPTVYISQSGGSPANGSSCADAYSLADLNANTHNEWSPGIVIGLCGTLSAGGNSNVITAHGSGTAGNPITVYWEPGASVQALSCSLNACLNTNGNQYLTLNGGSNGSVLATADGTGRTYHNDSYGIYADGCNYCVIENLTVANMYVRTSTTDSNGAGDALQISGTNWTVTNNTFHDAADTDMILPSGSTNDVWSYNNEYNMNHMGNLMPDPGASVGSVFIYGNHFHDWANWDDTTGADAYHHNGIHCYRNGTSGGTPSFAGVYIYNNRFDGKLSNPGNSGDITGPIFLEPPGNGTPCSTTASPFYLFNNVFQGDQPDGDAMDSSCCNGTHADTFNNTVMSTFGPSGGVCASLYGAINENNIFSGCEYLVQNGSASDTQVNYSALDYNIYDNGGDSAWEYASGTTAPYTSSGFQAWKTAMGGHDTHSCAIDDNGFSGTGSCPGNPTSLGLNTGGAPQTGSPALGAGGNLTSICTALPTTPVNTQSACQTTYTGPPTSGTAGSTTTGTTRPTTGAWNAGAY